MLTQKQLELLKFIHEKSRESGITPSYEEMATALNLASKSGVHRLVSGLEERGFVRRLPNRARAIEILRIPESIDHRLSATSGFVPRVVEGGRRPADDSEAMMAPAIPLMGRIAAGTPIQAIETLSHSITVPPAMLGPGQHYALEVKGDSMIDAGIFDGDTVVVRRQDTAAVGEIVVALVDDEEATLKRLRRKGDIIALEAANPAYQTRIFSPDRVKIQGRMVGLLRKY